MEKQRIIVGISGASGFQYGFKALQLLKDIPHIETHLVMSKGAELTREYETDIQAEQLTALADVIHPIQNLGASIASGSFKTLGMIVAPCSMRTLASIAHGMSDNLLTRAADVVLKERRKLLLMVRETPLHLVHLENMQKVTQMGGIIFPPVPALYHQPKTVDEIVTHSVSRALDMFVGIEIEILRWNGQKEGK
ncbi:UbiX family flavin prenyltransferase [Otariodibacter oris]|uniref:Flavin prenyltransferase UbiX n=1 Tax=Otariodibacter oris TaxID=1032623 RepID=A0A420XFP7_9PAST|nr:UbiX family flavin prenyltransferase [Otariodibacter oris]QGM80254.1 aromatic acid decarboxylase [Otariodibacter oris]RKR71620.1 4-hydroxy-3-polyprenylbenzoate decarboxylase [Otariodibacter oris]